MGYSKSLATILLATSAISLVNGAIGPKADLVISNAIVSPDGFNRSAVVVNGGTVGPLLRGNKGARFQVNVINKLNDPTMLRSTSIHWHGVFQQHTGYADGVVGVTQCPISPQHSFLYDFTAGDQAGTFWYHSHYGAQYCDGLRGPLVIYDPNDPHKSRYDIDDESTVITLTDWYHLQSPSIGLPQADSALINGKGRYPGGPAVDLAVINVVRGKRYRFRLLSISCDVNYFFSIDNHNLTVIEADGEATEPLTVDQIRIFAGQRYSFVLNANKPVANYWIRSNAAIGVMGIDSGPMGFDGGINSAILRYSGAPKADPTTTQSANPVLLDESKLHALINPAAPGRPVPGGVDTAFNFIVGVDINAGRFLMNGVTFEPPKVPILLQILNGEDPRGLMPQGSVFTVERNKVIEVSIPGNLTTGNTHPFHLHGHPFSVVKSVGDNVTPNYVNPVRRDVVDIGSTGSNVTFRFTTDNPGPWILHCHIDFHLELGLALVFAEAPGEVQFDDLPPPRAWRQLCPIFDALPPSSTSVSIVTPAQTSN